MRGHRIYLVRHGEAAASWGQSPDPGLSELGRRQAEAVGRQLQASVSHSDITLLSSPLQRARETAEPLASSLGLDVLIDDRFREIPSPVPLSERQDWLRGFMREPWAIQPDALQAWRGDIVAAVAAFDSPVVVFTHFLVINALVGWFDKHNDTLVFWPDNASVTTLLHSADGLAVEQLGEQMRTRVN
jgi:probable phosphoglycerate mutase